MSSFVLMWICAYELVPYKYVKPQMNLQTAEIIPLTEAVILLREVHREEKGVAEHPLSFKLNYLLI